MGDYRRRRARMFAADRKKETARYYDAVAETSFAEWFGNDALLPTLKAFRGRLSEKPLVLDLGCGTGGESKRMVGLGAEVIGIDYSLESIKLARANVPDARFIYQDLLAMRFKANSFDGVFEAGVLFHFKKREQARVLKMIHAMLKGGGTFLSIYPEGSFEGYDEMKQGDRTFKRYARRLPKEDWKGEVERRGLAFVEELPFDIGRFRALVFKKSE
jgi:SAM-dependent methyltransferase